MELAKPNPPVFLDWPDCAQLCKGPVQPEIVSLHFQWGPTQHVLRRLLGTTSLPNLRELHLDAGPSFTSGPLQLFQELRRLGRPLDLLTILIANDLAKTRLVRFDLTPLGSDEFTVKLGLFTPTIYASDIVDSLDGFGLTAYFTDPLLSPQELKSLDTGNTLEERIQRLRELFPTAE